MRNENNNTLIVGDLHIPFEHENYMSHCIEIKKKYNCKRIIFIGDIQDAHAESYWETNPDGHSAGAELNLVKNKLKEWQKAFRKEDVYVVIGNHDAIPSRKMFSSGLSRNWIKGFPEVYETPTWKYSLEWKFDSVLYTHGQGCANLCNSILNQRMSIVVGHFHTKFEILYNSSEKDLLWGMYVGCGISPSKYAFEYAKYNVKRPVLGCGVVIDGKPYLEPMSL
ncbi:MAG: metallophosphoesterase [Bacteroidales bacterium]|nr:metallophosphoesterase [Bacteroidales bacterium]